MPFVWSFILFAVTASACGVCVHLSLIQDLVDNFPQRILANSPYLRAGAFFPDAFYDCFSQSDAAEAAHWPPFLEAGAALVREKRSQGVETAPLEAFLVGVLTHQVADVSWHSLGIQQGLLRAMANREFNGNVNEAHSALDIGGDMIYLNRNRDRNNTWLKGSWDYNLPDIRELLDRVGYQVTDFQVNYCMGRGIAALQGELQAAPVAYARYATQSPLLFDELEEYYAGSTLDMKAQILECYPSLEKWFRGKDIPKSSWDICQVFAGKKPGKEKRSTHTHTPARVYWQALVKSLKRVKVSVVNHTQISADQESFGGNTIVYRDELVVAAPESNRLFVYNGTSLRTTIQGSTKKPGLFEPRFGTAMDVLHFDGREFLVVSAPGLSQVYIYEQDEPVGVFEFGASTTYGCGGLKQVGQSLATGSYDSTIYVGAPYADVQGSPQAGAVFVITEADIKACLLHGKAKVSRILGDREPAPYQRFGTRLSTAGRFVLVGSPGEEKVYGYDPLAHFKILELESGFERSGFGGYLLDANADHIAIGAPLLDDQKGAIYLYKNMARTKVCSPDPQQFDWFGYTGGFHQDKLYVSSPHGNDDSGLVWRVDRGGTVETLGRGPLAGGRFGRSLSTNGTHLYVGAPVDRSVYLLSVGL